MTGDLGLHVSGDRELADAAEGRVDEHDRVRAAGAAGGLVDRFAGAHVRAEDEDRAAGEQVAAARERARSASSDIPSWVWALIRKSTSESASHADTAIATHFTTRPSVIFPRSRGGRGSPPPSRERDEPALEGVEVSPAAEPPERLLAGAVDLVLRGAGFRRPFTPLCISTRMPPRRVIGIDAGGTKLLGGSWTRDSWSITGSTAPGAEPIAARRSTSSSTRSRRCGRLAPDADVVGFGIPALVEWETGVSRWSNHLPLADVPFRDLMSERLGMPVVVDNDGNASMLAEARAGAASSARYAVMVALGTGIGSGLLIDGRRVPGRARVRPGAGPRGALAGRGRLSRRLPRARLLRGARIRDCDRSARAVRGGRANRTPSSGGGRGRPRDQRRDRHGAGARRRSGGARGAGRDRPAARVRPRRRGKCLQPRGDRDRRRRGSRRRAADRARSRGGCARMRCRRRGRESGSCRRTSATRPGCWGRP